VDSPETEEISDQSGPVQPLTEKLQTSLALIRTNIW
jgi:hypothetical protein